MKIARGWIIGCMTLYLSFGLREVWIRHQQSMVDLHTPLVYTRSPGSVFPFGVSSLTASGADTLCGIDYSYSHIFRVRGIEARHPSVDFFGFREHGTSMGDLCYLNKIQKFLVPDSWRDQLLVFGPDLKPVGSPIPVGDYPISVLPIPDGHSVFVLNYFGGSLMQVEVAQGKVLQTVSIPRYSRAIILATRHQRLFVAGADDQLWEFTLDPLTLYRKIPVGHHPTVLAISKKEDLIFTANAFDSSISVVDLESGRLIRRLRLPEPPNGIVEKDGLLWTSLPRNHTVVQINPHTGEILRQFETQTLPGPILFTHTMMWVLCEYNGQVNRF